MKFYSGGLAELVSNPSEQTYKYLKEWLTPKTLSQTAKILNLPNWKSSNPLIDLQDGQLLVNLQTEEEILYAGTIFSYARRNNIDEQPKLMISSLKLLNPKNWIPTLQILKVQTLWLSNPQKIVDQCKTFIEEIKTAPIDLSSVWSRVIAVGLVAEFFHHSFQKEWKEAVDSGQSDDWFTSSLHDQQKVKTGEWAFDQYIKIYGDRADRDYELTSPRWSTIPKTIKKRIEDLPKQTRINAHTQLSEKAKIQAELIFLRGEARRYMLHYLADISKKLKTTTSKKSITKIVPTNTNNSMPISPGEVTGTVLQIRSSTQKIPHGTIGIFPNATTDFTFQFPKCAGIIFLRGGQTSHGAIVAREFHIPALVDSSAANIPNKTKLTINGTTGEWSLLK